MDIPPWLILPLSPIIGSWLGVLIRPGPSGRDRMWGRSACEACGHVLGAADLVPIVSFIALRGRCRYCRGRIGWFPLGVELAAVAVGAAALLAAGSSAFVWIDAALGWALLTVSWIDAETFRLPDRITLPLLLAGLVITMILSPSAIYNHALAAALGYGGFRLLNIVYRKLRRRDGLGAGDAKLLAAAGAWLGLAALPYVILLAGVLGIGAILCRRLLAPATDPQAPIAFGPALALALFAMQLAG